MKNIIGLFIILCICVLCLSLYSADVNDYLIGTVGCYIPNYMKGFFLADTENYTWPYWREDCGMRVIHIDLVSNGKFKFRIDYKAMRNRNLATPLCQYRIMQTDGRGRKKCAAPKRMFSNGQVLSFKHDTMLDVSCFTTEGAFYYDRYTLLTKKAKHKKGNTRINQKQAWNVLIIGMDTMSRGRARYRMPKLFKYLEQRKWLDYRAYNKVAHGSWPNVMAIMTGNTQSKIKTNSQQPDDFNLLSYFNNSGYAIAYGEDTNSPLLGKHKLFDHYLKMTDNSTCFGRNSAPEQTLEYASQFVKAYKKDKFFGLFWFKTASIIRQPYLIANPLLFQDSLINFFNYLQVEGILNNTFVFFIGDHGFEYGKVTYLSEKMFYESRLPIFYLWAPYQFRKIHPDYYDNLHKNQFRLTSPYDVYATLGKILKLSDFKAKDLLPTACSDCTSLMQEISIERKCVNASIPEELCTCHNMKDAREDGAAYHSIQLALADINRRLLKANLDLTSHQCEQLKIRKILRSHSYVLTNKNTTYYVSVVSVQPGRIVFESIVEKSQTGFKILDLRALNEISDCASLHATLQFCQCPSNTKTEPKLRHVKKAIKFIPMHLRMKWDNTSDILAKPMDWTKYHEVKLTREDISQIIEETLLNSILKNRGS